MSKTYKNLDQYLKKFHDDGGQVTRYPTGATNVTSTTSTASGAVVPFTPDSVPSWQGKNPDQMTDEEWNDYLDTKANKWKTKGQDDYSYTGSKCTYSHPALKLPGTDFVIYGGSCGSPSVTDADVYIGFDSSMKNTRRRFPWCEGDEIYFHISDMRAPRPDEEKDFGELLEWTKAQVDAGRKVHCGCIGGHGRTGLFLSALVSMYGEKDAITYVRDNYCKKAVETSEQVNWLAKKYQITTVQGAKSGHFSKASSHFKDSEGPKKSNGGSSKADRFTPVIDWKTVWLKN